MALVNRVIKNSVALWGSQGFHSLVSLCAIAIIARYLGVARFGEYGFVLAICNIFQVITDMGANQILIREVARRRDNVEEYFTANLIIMGFFGTLVFLLIIGTVYAFRPGQEMLTAAVIGAFAVILLFVSQLFGAVFQAFEKMEFVALMRSLGYGFYLGGVVLVVAVDGGMLGVFAALLVQNVVACIAGYGLTRRYFFKPRLVLNTARVREVLGEGWPVGANAMLRKLTYRVDILFLKAMATPTDLGLFNGMYRIILQLQFIPRNVTSALFPVFSRFAGEETSSLSDVHSRSAKFLFTGCVPIVAALLIFPEQIISLVLGQDFVVAVPLMRLLAAALALLFLSTLFINMLTALNKQRQAAGCVAACLGMNIICDILFIPTYGFLGAGMATLAAETLLFLVTGGLVLRYLVVGPLVGSGVKLCMAGLVMAAVWVGFGSQTTWYTFVMGGLAYPFLLWGFRVFDDQESVWIQTQVKRLYRHFAKV